MGKVRLVNDGARSDSDCAGGAGGAGGKEAPRLILEDIPKYTEIKQMVEATMQRILLEPVQETQSPDVIVYQNGVLNLKSRSIEGAWIEREDAPIAHSHAVWSYFDRKVWDIGIARGMCTMGERFEGEHFELVYTLVKEACPTFSKYMDEWFPRDKAAVEIILRWFGYCMTTDNRQNKFMFFYGPTRAGKGSIARLLCGIVGSNNYASANYSALEDKFQAICMHDKLVVTMEEVEAGPKEHERRMGTLKKYLGGERITWEQKYSRTFEDAFIGKIIMQANEVLAYEDKGQSVTARMIPMEFRESFFGSGDVAPEQEIFNNNELNAIATIAGLCWFRMTFNKIRGVFDFKNEAWSLQNCEACFCGKGTLVMESHKIAWAFLESRNKISKNKSEFKKYKKENKLIKCTRENLKELTELLLEFTDKNVTIKNLRHILCEAVRRDFTDCEEICFKSKALGRKRGWYGLYINTKKLENEYPELVENISAIKMIEGSFV